MELGERCVMQRDVAGTKIHGSPALGSKTMQRWTRLLHPGRRTFEPDALEGLLPNAGVPVHRVASSADIFADPQLSARGHITYLEHPRLGTVPIETSRIRFSRTPATAAWCGPEIGQHNDYVLREILQMTDQEMIELAIDKALE
jgi:crotonobetainyl-CoA:carnitine CoA-transferase CaiB-like acyl-CoA transferase